MVTTCGCVKPYPALVPVRQINCEIVYYEKTPTLHGMSNFNVHGADYQLSPYLTMFQKAPQAKFPDDKEWDVNHPEYYNPRASKWAHAHENWDY